MLVSGQDGCHILPFVMIMSLLLGLAQEPR